MDDTKPDRSVQIDYQESNFLFRRLDDLNEKAFQAKKACIEGAEVAKKYTIIKDGTPHLTR